MVTVKNYSFPRISLLILAVGLLFNPIKGSPLPVIIMSDLARNFVITQDHHKNIKRLLINEAVCTLLHLGIIARYPYAMDDGSEDFDEVINKIQRKKSEGEQVCAGFNIFKRTKKRVNAIAQKAHITIDDVRIIDLPQFRMNALAINVGDKKKIFIGSGWDETEENARQLHTVLAHEIAHHKQNHVNLFTQSINIVPLISFLFTGLQLLMSHKQHSTFSIKALTFASVLSKMIAFNAISRMREYEADHVGAQLLTDLGENGKEKMVSMLNFIRKNHPDTATAEEKGFSELFLDHPHPQSRINALK